MRTQAQFCEDFAEALIDMTFDSMAAGRRGSSAASGAADEPAFVRYGVRLHLTSTLKRRHKALAEDADQGAQRMFRVCKKYSTSSVCLRCREVNDGEVSCCGPITGRNCFHVHMREVHAFDV